MQQGVLFPFPFPHSRSSWLLVFLWPLHGPARQLLAAKVIVKNANLTNRNTTRRVTGHVTQPPPECESKSRSWSNIEFLSDLKSGTTLKLNRD